MLSLGRVRESLLLQPSCLPNSLFGGIDLLELFFCCFSDILAERGHAVGMVFQCQLSVGSLHLVVCSRRCHAQDFIGSIETRTSVFQVEHGVYVSLAQSQSYRTLLQCADLLRSHRRHFGTPQHQVASAARRVSARCSRLPPRLPRQS